MGWREDGRKEGRGAYREYRRSRVGSRLIVLGSGGRRTRRSPIWNSFVSPRRRERGGRTQNANPPPGLRTLSSSRYTAWQSNQCAACPTESSAPPLHSTRESDPPATARSTDPATSALRSSPFPTSNRTSPCTPRSTTSARAALAIPSLGSSPITREKDGTNANVERPGPQPRSRRVRGDEGVDGRAEGREERMWE